MTAASFRQALSLAGLTNRQFADWAFIHRRTVQRWAKHGAPKYVLRLFQALEVS
jgi:hypothetical protein